MYKENKSAGFTLGCDGCGVVVEIGEGVKETLKGKKVAFLGGGWSNYTCKEAKYLVELDDDMDLAVGANAYVNPFTCLAMFDYALKKNATAVISLAASSALGKMFIRLCEKENMQVINVVRKDENVEDLKRNHGAKYVLN